MSCRPRFFSFTETMDGYTIIVEDDLCKGVYALCTYNQLVLCLEMQRCIWKNLLEEEENSYFYLCFNLYVVKYCFRKWMSARNVSSWYCIDVQSISMLCNVYLFPWREILFDIVIQYCGTSKSKLIAGDKNNYFCFLYVQAGKTALKLAEYKSINNACDPSVQTPTQ